MPIILSLKNRLFLIVWLFACSFTFAQRIEPSSDFKKYAYTGPTNAIGELEPLPDGKIMVMGAFEYFQSFSAYVVRLNADGSRDETFNSKVKKGTTARPLAVQNDGKILLSETIYEGSAKKGIRLFRILADGSWDDTYNPTEAMQISELQTLLRIAIDRENNLIIMGQSGLTIQLLRMNTDGTKDANFTPTVNLFCTEPVVTSLHDGKILVKSCSAGGLVRLNNDGSPDNSFQNTNLITGPVITNVLERPDGKLWVFGTFSSNVNGVVRTNMVRLMPDGTLDETYIPAPNASISSVLFARKLSGSEFTLRGSFQIDGAPRSLVRMDENGQPLKAFSLPPNPSFTFDALPLNTGKALLARSINDAGKSFLVLVNEDGTLDPSFDRNEGFDNIFSAQPQPDGKIMVCGKFSHFGLTPIPGSIARLNADGSLDETFNVGGTGFDIHRYQSFIPLADGKALCIDANYYNQELVGPLFRLNADGTRDKTYNDSFKCPVASDDFHSLTIIDDKILISATSRSQDNEGYRRLLRLMPDGSLDPDFQDIPTVAAITKITQLPGGKLLLVGKFPFLPDEGRYPGYLARWNSDFTTDETFATTGKGFNHIIAQAEILPNGKIIVAGLFDQYDETPVQALVRLQPDGHLDTSFHPPFEGLEVGDISINEFKALPNGKLLLIGTFRDINDNYTHIMILNQDGSLYTGQEPLAFEGNLGQFRQYTSSIYGGFFREDNFFVLGDFIRLQGGDYQSLLAGFKLHCDPFEITVPQQASLDEGNELKLTATEQRDDLAYEWHKDNQVIGDQDELQVTQVGSYSVAVTDGCGTTKTQNIDVTLSIPPITAVGSTETCASPHAFPNPFNNSLALCWNTDYPGKIEFLIIDNLGRTKRRFEAYKTELINDFQLDGIDSLEKGLYILKINAGTTQYTASIVKF